MKAVRWLVTVAILAYAVWLAVPLVTPWSAPGGAPHPASGGPLLLGLIAVCLYVVSAAMFARDKTRAFLVYLAAFAANLALFVMVHPAMDLAAGSDPSANLGFDAHFGLIGALAVAGFVMLTVGRSRSTPPLDVLAQD
jgi:hypothetical protein